MIISKREEIFNILNALPYSVFQCRVDSFQGPMIKPAISVQSISKRRTNFDTGGYHDVDEVIEIIVTLTNPTNYFRLIDDVVLAIETSLMTNADWISQFSENPEINTTFEYGKAGETNQASAEIKLALKYQDEFTPDITALLERIHIDTDVISPAADPNLLPNGEVLGPDGRIELTSDITLDQ